MNDFKVGDPVEYVGPSADIKAYGTLTVSGESGITDRICVEEVSWAAILPENLRHFTPAPDVLTIPRDELPEVVEVDGFLRANGMDFGYFMNAAAHRKRALAQLAVSEFLAAREKAEQDAADQHAAILGKRRDELAVQYFEGAYHHLPRVAYRTAIDRIIQLEGQVKK